MRGEGGGAVVAKQISVVEHRAARMNVSQRTMAELKLIVTCLGYPVL